MVSDTNMKNDVEVSCWNCFNVEDSDRDMDPLPLSKIRKAHRQRLKLYSFLASEISKPKAVSLKQKVSENYSVGKRLEENITKTSSSNYHSLHNNDVQEDAKIVHRVQIQTSTPKIKRKIKKDQTSRPISDDEKRKTSNDVSLTVAMKNIHDLSHNTETVTVDNSSSNGSESGYAGSSITVREQNEAETNKSLSPSPSHSDEIISASSPQLDKSIKFDKFKSSLPALHLSKSNTLTTSTKSLYSETKKPLKSLRWSTICVDQGELSLSDGKYYSS